jgi:membrane protease YdiL (CAAX protease family)
VKTFIKSHPVAIYFATTFAISWGGLLAVGGPDPQSTTWQSDPKLPYLFVAMLAGPSVAGILLTVLVSERTGLRVLFARVRRWRVGARWYAVALLSAPVVFTAVAFALSLVSPVFLPGIVITDDTPSLLLISIAGALIVGVLEEIGWTGFAIPRLRLRHGVLATGLIVGVPWGAWHLLTNDFWLGRIYYGGLPAAVFLTVNAIGLLAGQLPAYRVLMVWVYDRTGSLLVAMLMHASLSASTFILGPSATGWPLLIYGFALAAAWWLIVAVVAAAAGVRVSRSVPHHSTA